MYLLSWEIETEAFLLAFKLKNWLANSWNRICYDKQKNLLYFQEDIPFAFAYPSDRKRLSFL